MNTSNKIEHDVVRDFQKDLSYGAYLHLDEVLGAQHPVSVPEHHDELLFIIQHQTSELWLKLMLHELRSVCMNLAVDDLRSALKKLARVKHIQRTMTEQWSVLTTLTPTEFAEFRQFLGSSSGFQSYQYRALEFLLGNKNEQMLLMFEHCPAVRQMLAGLLEQPSVYDEFLRYLYRHGHEIPKSILHRDLTKAHVFEPVLVAVFKRIYEAASEHWDAYQACEALVDVEDNFQFWRFRHVKTVERTIGFKRGTGGSSGADFLRRALDQTFFPELYAVRTEVGILQSDHADAPPNPMSDR